ncbi:MAG: hypothetical protein ACOYKF_03950, partial [Phenylobacterium sp.]
HGLELEKPVRVLLEGIAVLFMLIALAFVMIIDLDRPGDGFIIVSEANMNDMVNDLPSYTLPEPKP